MTTARDLVMRVLAHLSSVDEWEGVNPHIRRLILAEWEATAERHLADEPPLWAQNSEAAVGQVYGSLSTAFYQRWREEYPKPSEQHEPRPMSPEAGHARSVCRWLLASCSGDVTAARNKARELVESMFRDGNMTRTGRPWRWVSVSKDPGHFFLSAMSPARDRAETAKAKEFDRGMAKAARDQAPAEVGRAALAAIKASST